MFNGVSVSLLIRHWVVFLDQCHGKRVNDLVLETKRIFPLCLYKTVCVVVVVFKLVSYSGLSLWLCLNIRREQG